MGKRGKTSNAPGGYGSIHEGYRRIEVVRDGKRRRIFEHVHVWEEANGPLPKGWIVHHKDHDKLNNRIENLEAMSRQQHMAEHGNRRTIDGVEYKRCSKCKEERTIDLFYKTPSKCKRYTFIMGRCVFCWAEKQKENREKRKRNGVKLKTSRIGRDLYGPPRPPGQPRRNLSGLLQLNKETSGPEK